MIEVSVAYGEITETPDLAGQFGSMVERWKYHLYPETFAKDKRLVISQRRSFYFSVKKDTASPFIVETSQLSVKVLGTRFNVKAYPNDGENNYYID